jgi:hypothetical protein
MKAAEMRCGPARTRIGLRRHRHAVGIRRRHESIDVEHGRALAVDRDLDVLAARVAAGECAGGLVIEEHLEQVLAVGRKMCTTDVPPRVPNGAPSTCSVCDAVRGTLYVAELAVAFGFPTASQLISLAARR